MGKAGFFGILLGVAYLVLTGTSQAQIEITWDEYKLDVGTLFEQESAGDTVAVDLCSPGGPQIWDFTSQVTPIAIGFEVVKPESTPFAGEFPSANFVIQSFILDGETQWDYHQVTPTYSEFQGWGWQYPDTLFYKKFSPAERIPLPISYESSYHYEWGWSDTIEAGPPLILSYYSLRGYQAVDAYGTVKIPLREYEVLRLCSFDTCTTVLTSGGDTVSTVTTTYISYSWLSEGFGGVVGVVSFPDETNPNYTQAPDFNRLKSFSGIADGGPTSLHPCDFRLDQNYPNPFNPMTTIEYAVPNEGLVRLKIYNTAGQLVKTLVDELKVPGNYSAIWDGRNESGAQVASGVYLYKLTAGGSQIVRKMVILR